MSKTTYYATAALLGATGFELRQTRFIGNETHPHDVCAVSTTVKQLVETVAILKGSIDWSRVTKPATPPKSPAQPIPDCPSCGGQRESNGRGGWVCFFCGRDA